jgi:uncharacterized membrane protein YczE
LEKQRIPVVRTAVYILGMIIYGFAVCLMVKADIGISPISSISFAFYHIFPSVTLGMTQFIINGILVLAQVIWMGKEFEKIQYFQFAASIIFSIFIDLTMPFATMLASINEGLVFRIVLFTSSMLIMATGLSLIVMTGLIMLPGDGMAKTASKKLNWNFGKAKVVFDSFCVIITCIISLLVLRKIVGIQVGTIVAALVLGRLTRFLIPKFKTLIPCILD